jgi:hypothetical protein
MKKDSRGRVRFTNCGIRYEINRHGVIRAYVRDRHGRDTERKHPVVTHGLNAIGRFQLREAVKVARGEG